MNPRIQHLIKNPFEVQDSDVALLQDEIEKYPYFSMLRALLLFGLKEFEHPSYQEELKKTSIYSPSRVALFHYLQKERQASTQEESIESLTEDADEELAQLAEAEMNSVQTDDFALELEPESDPIEKPELDSKEEEPEIETKVEEVSVQKSEMTFSEWLSLTKSQKKKPSTEKEPKVLDEKEIKFRLIDEFIEKAPKISRPNKEEAVKINPVKPTDTQEYSDLMTETLAQIYWEQKMYEKAIRAYKILGLKYPDKKELFDEKIEEINQQRNA